MGARSLQPRHIISYLDIRLNASGLIAGTKLAAELEAAMGPSLTEVRTGHEIWLTHGRIVDALRASYALPGIFAAVMVGDRWLVDGALVNPVPVWAARAFGSWWMPSTSCRTGSPAPGWPAIRRTF
jgi:NTE family protein